LYIPDRWPSDHSPNADRYSTSSIRAVGYLATQAGISQFLDIGTGLPAQGSVHEIAQSARPGARVVYVDNDPVVVSHGRALLAKAPGVLAVEGDLRYPRELLTRRAVREFLDFTQPVAVLLVAVLHFVGDAQCPWQAVSAITRRIAPGSYVVISHVTGDDIPARAPGDWQPPVRNTLQTSSRLRS
jgi:SAM-dependent methyltransferase